VIGIVIPTYNEARNIDRLLKSIQAQTYSEYRVVIVDQGSSDQTASIAQSYGCMIVEIPRPDAHIPWITGPFPPRSRNLGSKAIDSQILLHLDADMELGSVDFLDRLTRLFDDRHEAAVIEEVDSAIGFWAKCKALERSCYRGTAMEAARAVTRDVFEAVGGYDEGVSSGEDYIATKLYERETLLARDPSLLLIHHTGRQSLRGLLKKKYVYGRTAKLYLRRADAIGGRSAASIARTSLMACLNNWRLVFRYPALYVCVFILRGLEFCAVQAGSRSAMDDQVSGQSQPVSEIPLPRDRDA
jgi:glycosyltransferase involved in cell wall biosynthesis